MTWVAFMALLFGACTTIVACELLRAEIQRRRREQAIEQTARRARIRRLFAVHDDEE